MEGTLAKIFIWGRTWHSKWHEDLLSCVGMNDGLRAESTAWGERPRAARMHGGADNIPAHLQASRTNHLPAWSSGLPTAAQGSREVCFGFMWFTWILHIWLRVQLQPRPSNEYSPEGRTLRGGARHVCSHQAVSRILSIVSEHKYEAVWGCVRLGKPLKILNVFFCKPRKETVLPNDNAETISCPQYIWKGCLSIYCLRVVVF